MDKVKFQDSLSQSLEHIYVIQCKINCFDESDISSSSANGTIINYDLLLIEQHINDVALDISISFREEIPWATINIKGASLGVGFYAHEDPDNIVWNRRVFDSLKAELVKKNVARNFKAIIDAICAAYNKSI